MKITGLNPQNTSFQQRKFPRYIYHLTDEKSYQSILKDGFIRVSEKDPYALKNGVYTIELPNFLHFWGDHKDWNPEVWVHEPLSKSLLRAAVRWINTEDKKKCNLVILKIPTSSLDLKKLSSRNQHTFFKRKMAYHRPPMHMLPPKIRENLEGRTNVLSDETRKQRKHKAIEYIYFDNITTFERIGEIVNIPEIRKTEEFKKHPVRTILSRLLKNTPEGKGIKIEW